MLLSAVEKLAADCAPQGESGGEREEGRWRPMDDTVDGEKKREAGSNDRQPDLATASGTSRPLLAIAERRQDDHRTTLTDILSRRARPPLRSPFSTLSPCHVIARAQLLSTEAPVVCTHLGLGEHQD